MHEADLFAAMRAAPEDDAPRLVYADWLLARGDVRGMLILLEQRERAGEPLTVAQLDQLLELASRFGFPRLPDDPCADIFRFTGGGSFPTQYWLHHAGHEYYLRWRYGFSIEVDDETVLEGDLDTLTTNEWTFRETNVILAIVSTAIRAGSPLSELRFPDQAGLRTHPRYHVGRSPLYGFPDDLYDPDRRVELRDRHRWYHLYDRRQRLVGLAPPPARRLWRCACGAPGLTCGVTGCDIPPDA